MKFIFSFLLYLILSVPALADNTCDISDANICDATASCGWGGYACDTCAKGEYNPGSPTNTNGCLSCATDFTPPSGASVLPTNQQNIGQSSCPWVCDSGYFEDSGHNECFQCPTQGATPQTYTDPTNIGNCSCGSTKKLIKTNGNEYYCGLCGVGISGTTSATNITQCNCADAYGANRVYGLKTVNNIRVECKCPDDADWNNTLHKCVCNDPNKSLTLDSTTNTYVCRSCIDPHATNNGGTCICNAGYYGNPVGLNTECHACPTNSTSVVNGVANAAGATSIDQCKCDQNHPIRSTNATTGAVTCSACPSNATSYTTGTDFEYECKCDANYYGNGYISCDKCPAGTTKSVGGSSGSNGRQAPTTQADCKFSNNTKFCIPSTTRTVDNSGYMCFTPNNVTYLY